MDAILFPGLSPSPHRNVRRFLAASEGARTRFDEASDILGYDLEKRYANADIYDWEPYQIAFLAINLALAEWVQHDLGRRAEVVCGQSFGGFVAAVESGSITFRQMVALISASTKVENEYFTAAEEALACVFFSRVHEQDVEDIVESASAAGGWAQLSVRGDRGVFAVSGRADTVAEVERAVRARRGIVYHTINRAEHCPQVQGLRDRLERETYARFTFVDSKSVFLSDVTGEGLSLGSAIRNDLLDGWTHPTHASTLYDGLQRSGVERLVVCGVGSSFNDYAGGRFITVPVSPARVAEALR